MSLRDFGVFNPLAHDHPMACDGSVCWKCGENFGAGSRVALNPVETADETGSRTVRAEAVCATCRLRGEEVSTPEGRRIVERVKDGDGSPFPIITTDGKQWADDEVNP